MTTTPASMRVSKGISEEGEMMGQITWISEDQWRALLADSERIHAQIRAAKINRKPTDALWAKLRPINEAIRSPYIKVSGIDDLTVEQRREKAMRR